VTVKHDDEPGLVRIMVKPIKNLNGADPNTDRVSSVLLDRLDSPCAEKSRNAVN
jgi:hypothetical protein